MIPGLRRSPKEGNGYPLQYSGLENSMDYIVHGVTKSWTQLSDFHFLTRLVRMWGKGNPGALLMEIEIGIVIKENSVEIPQTN